MELQVEAEESTGKMEKGLRTAIGDVLSPDAPANPASCSP